MQNLDESDNSQFAFFQIGSNSIGVPNRVKKIQITGNTIIITLSEQAATGQETPHDEGVKEVKE